MSALWMKNTSGSDPHSYEVTKGIAKKAQKNFFRLQQDSPHDLHDTSAML